MTVINKKNHWEKVYETKGPNEVSWTQEVPEVSLEFINRFNLDKSAPVIDVGGGDSRLADFLLDQGFTDITVLDISERALEKAKVRLGEKAGNVKWIVADITEFVPDRKYVLWHDRAVFHFLTDEKQIAGYREILEKASVDYLVIGTFSENGPEKCSGLEVKRYSKDQLMNTFAGGFKGVSCVNTNHVTPFNTIQNFTFCSFKRV